MSDVAPLPNPRSNHRTVHSPALASTGPQRLGILLARANRSAEEAAQLAASIHQRLLKESPFIRESNFQSIHPADLRRLFDCYDRDFFAGTLTEALGAMPLSFRLSRRLTSAAGTTTRRTYRRDGQPTRHTFEITISTTLLYQTFQDVARPIEVSGVQCRNRLESLQRIFEHELIHLAEMLVWNDSNCAASRFQQIAHRLFGHRKHTHQLITQRERAIKKFGLRVGDRVAFRLDGRHLRGIINRITRRATVLVENAEGRSYSDGKRYVRYYVPLDLLKAEKR